MKAKYITRKDGFPGMKKELGLLKGTGVEVGVLKGENQWLAGIHEYGCDIRVTEKMRGYLASQGLHLKKQTTHIHIPERSFLRSGYDQSRGEVAKKAGVLMGEVAAGRLSAGGCVQAVGLELSSKIKDYARDVSDPPNHPFTQEQKGSANPLVDTGGLIAGITWRESQ